MSIVSQKLGPDTHYATLTQFCVFLKIYFFGSVSIISDYNWAGEEGEDTA